LLRAELGRLRHRRLVGALALIGLVALLIASAALFFTHDTDIAGARAKAQADFTRAAADQREYHAQCLRDPNIPADAKEQACGQAELDPAMAEDAFYQDPRLRADEGLPAMAISIAVVGALLMALLGATAVGADWSSRAIVTLLTWQPRRLRFFATRLAAVALMAAAIGVVAQALGLGLTALTVSTRGTWQPTPAAPQEGEFSGGQSPGLIPPENFWRDLLSLQGRGVLLMVLAAVIAASIAMLTRSTGGFLGVALGWFVLVEVAGQGLLSNLWPTFGRYTLIQNVAALLTPGGVEVFNSDQTANGQQMTRPDMLSNLDGLLYLSLVAVAVSVVAAVLLRRRDL
jgi:hypothetical protein